MKVFTYVGGEFVPVKNEKTPLTMAIGDCYIETLPTGEEVWVQKVKHEIVDGALNVACESMFPVKEKVG